MKHSTSRSSGLFAQRVRSGASSLTAALMLAALASPAAAGTFQAPDVEVKEGETAVFAITLPSTQSSTIRYAYQTENASAKAGEDYEAKQGQVVFPAGVTRAQVEVRTYKNDDTNDEHFNLVLIRQQASVGWWYSVPAPSTGLPSFKTVRATILDQGRRDYEDEKYGPGHSGSTFGE